MPGACGIACEVCKLRDMCGGCAPGTDPRASERAKRLREAGTPCLVLECAIKKGVNHCLSCPDFPCETHYKAEIPYSRKVLDLVREIIKGQK